MSESSVVIVHSLDDLLALARNPRVNGFGPRARVQLQITGLSPLERNKRELALNRFQMRCGCIAAGLTALAVMAAGTLYVWRRVPTFFAWAAARQLLVVLALSLAAGSIAKLITVLVTRVQFKRLCRREHMKLKRLAGARGLSGSAILQ